MSKRTFTAHSATYTLRSPRAFTTAGSPSCCTTVGRDPPPLIRFDQLGLSNRSAVAPAIVGPGG